jgi:hypothetical protein
VALSAVCLRVAACFGALLALPGLRDDLGGFARELAGLNCLSCLIISCFRALPALTFGKIYEKNLYLGHISELKKNIRQVETEEHAGGKPRHARRE